MTICGVLGRHNFRPFRKELRVVKAPDLHDVQKESPDSFQSTLKLKPARKDLPRHHASLLPKCVWLVRKNKRKLPHRVINAGESS